MLRLVLSVVVTTAFIVGVCGCTGGNQLGKNVPTSPGLPKEQPKLPSSLAGGDQAPKSK
jgi:hypothetical protein